EDGESGFGNVVCCFFFQAEDGIRDRNVTGVQTCALPISSLCERFRSQRLVMDPHLKIFPETCQHLLIVAVGQIARFPLGVKIPRSEERRVGKECRSRWWPEH